MAAGRAFPCGKARLIFLGLLLLLGDSLGICLGLGIGLGLLLGRLLFFLFLAHVMADRAPCGRAQHTMTSGHVAGDAADRCAFQAAGAGDG